MQTHACQHNITKPRGCVPFLYLASNMGIHRLILMGRNLDNRKKLTLIWIVKIYWIVPVHSKLYNIMLVANQSTRDIKEFGSVNMDAW